MQFLAFLAAVLICVLTAKSELSVLSDAETKDENMEQKIAELTAQSVELQKALQKVRF